MDKTERLECGDDAQEGEESPRTDEKGDAHMDNVGVIQVSIDQNGLKTRGYFRTCENGCVEF